MEYFDKEKYIKNIYEEFRKTDAFYNSFRKQFVSEIVQVVREHHPETEKNPILQEDIKLYADEMINTAESVVYKDKSYPGYRLLYELEVMSRLVVKEPENNQNTQFIHDIHQKAKALMVLHYPEIFDLSANGFRLIEKYAKMYNWEFITNFYLLTEMRKSRL